jgi:hypothetical protein
VVVFPTPPFKFATTYTFIINLSLILSFQS